MHLTWVTGDPVIQLNFPNPLNTSVQVGDVAYFSNPTAVGGVGNPLSGQQWASTTTPHLANPQDGIIMIGEIIQIIPWDGVVSSIICNMPQDLFNTYFNDIISTVCTLTPDPNDPCSGDCCDYTPLYNVPVATGTSLPVAFYPAPYPEYNYVDWLWDNPTVSICDVMFHRTGPTSTMNLTLNNLNAAGQTPCVVNPGDKSVDAIYGQGNPSGFDDYIPTVGWENWWFKIGEYMISLGNSDVTAFLAATPCMNANDVLNGLMGLYPADYYIGMTFDQMNSARSDISVSFATGPIGGNSAGFTVDCVGGSFIMFSKDNKANMANMLGYYASVEYRNNSLEEAELFNVGAQVVESSK